MQFDLTNPVVQGAVIAGIAGVVSTLIGLGTALINLWAGVIHRKFEARSRNAEELKERQRQKVEEILLGTSEQLALVNRYVKEAEHFKGGFRGVLRMVEAQGNREARFTLLIKLYTDQGSLRKCWEVSDHKAFENAERNCNDWFTYRIPYLLVWLASPSPYALDTLKGLEEKYKTLYKELTSEVLVMENVDNNLRTFGEEKVTMRDVLGDSIYPDKYTKLLKEIASETENLQKRLANFL